MASLWPSHLGLNITNSCPTSNIDMSVLQTPSLALCHLARRKENCWRWPSRVGRYRPLRDSSLDSVRKLSTCDVYHRKITDIGGDRKGDSLSFINDRTYPHLWDLHDFKNGRNISVAEYLNIETKYVL